MRWRAASLRGLAAVLTVTGVAAGSAACGGGSDGLAKAEPRVTVATAAPPTTSPYAVPPVIDEAYVNRVLEGLDAAVGDIVRLVVRTRHIPIEVIDRVKAVFLERDDQNLELAGLQHDLREGLTAYRADPGNKKSTVAEVISSSAECIFVRATRDYSSVGNSPNLQLSTEWLVLKPINAAEDPNNYNPTPWMIAANGIAAPPNPCSGTS